MNLLDAVEKSVGNEYFNDGEHSEMCFDLQKADTKLLLSLNQSHQPNSNKIVNIK
ncbi:hypothetical protein [Legionella waltersii]|uniref:Uncharacterized protein n=1 Tax=Legionella waltersii TaxID=66969 RepID=A0A0W1A0N2_9GAMM|nr:hypothetical protein [Legionella waltersii]KTD74913.1 hypothetical protein Lwal_2954 [Legionella waltersii]SNV12242.1 Uncharacterised protein [Legionella waltersii]